MVLTEFLASEWEGKYRKDTRGYALLKYLAGFWHNNIFYRKVIVWPGNINPEIIYIRS